MIDYNFLSGKDFLKLLDFTPEEIEKLIDLAADLKNKKKNGIPHKYCEGKKLTGTARYASINALKGCEQGRRDDVEAIGYVLMYFLRGSLPWQGLKVKRNEDKYRKIYEKKKATTPQELCEGFPKQFCDYVKYTRGLSFEEEPNYTYLKGLMKCILINYQFEFDMIFDWNENKYRFKEDDLSILLPLE